MRIHVLLLFMIMFVASTVVQSAESGLADRRLLFACEGSKKIMILGKDGGVVWSLADTDVPDMGIRWFAGIQVLPGGNIFVCNAGGKVPFFEVTRDKKIAWQWNQKGPVLTGHGIQVLDVPGVLMK